MLYVEPKERALLIPNPPDDHHAEPEAVGGRDKKKGREFEYPVEQLDNRCLHITRHLG